MKIILVGDWHSELHEKIIRKSFLYFGHKVISFKWFNYFKPKTKEKYKFEIFKKIQNKYLFGPIIEQINSDLLNICKTHKAEVLFIYRGSHIYPKTLQKIKKKFPEIIIIGYNNDDPFSKIYPKWMWRHFINGLPNYDIMFAYREKNIKEFQDAGAKKVKLLRSWFDPERNYPKGNTKKYDVTFIGHYEDDNRILFLEEVVKRGWKLKLYGPGYEWNDIIKKSPYLNKLLPIDLVWGEDYNNALCNSKIALCFLSKVNNDTYTRRCFEIPATETLLMSEKTSDLTSLFQENNEAVFFEKINDFGEKLDKLLNNKWHF